MYDETTENSLKNPHEVILRKGFQTHVDLRDDFADVIVSIDASNNIERPDDKNDDDYHDDLAHFGRERFLFMNL